MRPGNRMRVGLLAAGEAGDDDIAILEAATARERPSGLQAAAGTVVRPPGKGSELLGLQVPERIAEHPRSGRRSRFS